MPPRSALAKQIEQGAPADVFVSADLKWMDYLAGKKLIKAGHARQSARQPAGADRAEGFQTRQRRRSARASTSPSSPATAASRSPIPRRCRPGFTPRRRLNALGAWAAAEPKLAQAENVRATLAFVARGETPLGIVYETDAKIEPKVKIVGAFPEGFAPAGHLSGGGDRGEQERRMSCAISISCARKGPRRSSRNTASASWCRRRRHSACLHLTPEDWTAIALSLRIAVVATLVALPFGIAIAMLLARTQFWGKALLDAVVYLPLVLPPVVTGYLLLITLGRRAPVGAFLADHFGIVFSFRWTGAALACGVMAFPLMVRAIRLSIEAIDARLEEAAAHARRQPHVGVRHRHAAADAARRHRRRHAGLRPRARRIRRHHHLRLQHSRRDADHFGGDLHADAGARRRPRRAVAGRRRRHAFRSAALVASEWLARRASARVHGA